MFAARKQAGCKQYYYCQTIHVRWGNLTQRRKGAKSNSKLSFASLRLCVKSLSFFKNSPSSQTETAADQTPPSAVQTPAAVLPRCRRCCLECRSLRDSAC